MTNELNMPGGKGWRLVCDDCEHRIRAHDEYCKVSGCKCMRSYGSFYRKPISIQELTRELKKAQKKVAYKRSK